MKTKNSPGLLPDFVVRYLDDRHSDYESDSARSWLVENINKSEFDQEFEKILDNISPAYDLESINRSRKTLEAFIAIEHEIRRSERKHKRISAWLASTAIAAAVAITALVFNKTKDPVVWHEIYAQRGQTENVVLSDGTCIQINSGSKIIYPSRFDSEIRSIYIDGEIFADVAKDPKKPFIVCANDIHIKVHGTQFNVKAFAEMDNVEVALISGSVTMEGRDSCRYFSKTLKPGDFVRYSKTSGSAESYRINPTAYVSGLGKSIRFINQSLEDIADDLERHFDVNILITDESLAQTQYYASFINNESLDKILSALNSNKTMNICRKNSTIVISNK